MKTNIRYSVVVPTYNRPATLARCLDSLARQDADDYEVIVVDDGSDPETVQVIEKIVRAHPQLVRAARLEINSGCAQARNRGIREARGAIVLFIDDDCEAPPEWIRTHADAHERYPEAVGVGGWVWPAEKHAKNQFERLYRLQFEGLFPAMRECEVVTNTMRSPAGNTANMSYKRGFLEETGGFDEVLYFTGGVDWELKARAIALQRTLVFIPLSVTHHKEYSWSSFIARSIRQGRGLDYQARKFIGLTEPTLYTALTFFGSWVSSPVTRGKSTGVFLVWLVCIVVGRWINRLTGFRPKIRYEMRNPRYFLQRFMDGKELTQHRMVPFSTESMPSHPLPFCSVIIPTFNRAELVAGAIRGVLEQYFPAQQYELIVVDDGSTDDTKMRVAALAREYPNHTVSYVYQENRGAALARNRGAEEAKGDLLFFTDSDCRVPRQWLYKHCEAYRQHPGISGTGGGILAKKGAGPLNRFRDRSQDNRFVALYRDTLVLTNDTIRTIVPYDSANMSVRKAIFDSVGGFYPVGIPGIALYHEDVDFVCRVQQEGAVMALVPGTAVTNMRSLSLRAFWHVAFIRGVTLPALCERIAPAGIEMRYVPVFSHVCARFLQCLLRFWKLYEWIHLLHLSGYYAGYRSALRRLRT